MTVTLKIDNVNIEIRRSQRRRHMDLTVDRDGSVVAAVPGELSDEQIERLVRSRLVSVHGHLARKREVLSEQPPKQFVTGEGFYYLGRKYRLKLIDDDAAPDVRLIGGRFVMPRRLTKKGRDLFVRWYARNGQRWLADRANKLHIRVAARPAQLRVRDLGFRWGSCSQNGVVHFHWRTVLLPPPRIDYLILHELCHLHEHNHSQAFLDRLRRASPDHTEHEEWLRLHGDRYVL